jgi:hypothetical protein
MSVPIRYRVVERPWETIERRRYAVECYVHTRDDGSEYWGLERFFSNPLEAQQYLGRLLRGPRVITNSTSLGAPR